MKWLITLALSISLQAFAQSASEALRITNPKSSLYEVLNVSQSATPEEIKTAYRKLMSVYHPDRHQNNPGNLKAATQVMTKLNAAREVLLDPLKRKSYDITVKATSPMKPAAEKPAPKAEPEKPKAEPKTSETSKAPPKTEPEVKVKKAEVRVEPPSTAVSTSNSATSYKAKQAQKVYTETSRCGVGYFKNFVDIML